MTKCKRCGRTIYGRGTMTTIESKAFYIRKKYYLCSFCSARFEDKMEQFLGDDARDIEKENNNGSYI